MNNCPYQNWDCSSDIPCSDCYWNRNNSGLRKTRFMQWFIFGLVFVFSVMLLFKWWNYQEQQIMSVDYCWDELGEHYVAPNINCR